MSLSKIFFILFAALLLVYLILPGPESVFDFPAPPKSTVSQEPGDTVQVPNIVAYFSYSFRDWVVPFYRTNYQHLTWFFFPPIRLNHPPEYSWDVVLNQVRSTYLEELAYPMRDSLFVNGFEPFLEDGTPHYQGATHINYNGVGFDTKTTLRYYPSPLWARLVLWLGICSSIYFLWELSKKVLRDG